MRNNQVVSVAEKSRLYTVLVPQEFQPLRRLIFDRDFFDEEIIQVVISPTCDLEIKGNLPLVAFTELRVTSLDLEIKSRKQAVLTVEIYFQETIGV